MRAKMNRRDFMKVGAAAGLAVAGGMPTLAQGEAAPAFKTELHKALIAGRADEATCERLAKAGFHGVELSDKTVSVKQAAADRAVAEKHGVKIHSFLGGWAAFNHADAAAREKSIEEVKQMIRLAGAYGASALLLVPCRVGGMAMPKPSQFKIDFDPKTLAASRVVDGDNAPFADYIAAQNRATELSRAAIEALLPTAAREGVIIAVENVWNNLWVRPSFFNAFVRAFDNPWVRTYFDLGNHVRYAPVEEWLQTLGSSIVKLHIKDFRIDRAKSNDGDFVKIGAGSIGWRSVRRTIDKIGYNGWVTIESEGYTDAEHSALMDRFFAGEEI